MNARSIWFRTVDGTDGWPQNAEHSMRRDELIDYLLEELTES